MLDVKAFETEEGSTQRKEHKEQYPKEAQQHIYSVGHNSNELLR